MDMSGEYRIPAPRQTVWDALNDPEVLKASIAGCEELEQTDDGGFTAKVRAKVGPVSARFSGKVNIVDPDPPNGYRIEGEGTGGAAGFAKGGANVKLAEDGGETVLTYEANASVGGKLAQIGSRLIDGTAKKMADDFFAKFSEIAAERAAAGAAPQTEAAEAHHHDDGTPAAWSDAAEELAEDAYDTARHAVEDAADAVSEAASETAHDVAEVADSSKVAAKGVPQWLWIAGAAVIVVGLLIFLS
jgi:carbon monoxide dehydrogenase subunit G